MKFSRLDQTCVFLRGIIFFLATWRSAWVKRGIRTSPRYSRSKSSCRSRTRVWMPSRAKSKPRSIPAGPPPTMQTSTSWVVVTGVGSGPSRCQTYHVVYLEHAPSPCRGKGGLAFTQENLDGDSVRQTSVAGPHEKDSTCCDGCFRILGEVHRHASA